MYIDASEFVSKSQKERKNSTNTTSQALINFLEIPPGSLNDIGIFLKYYCAILFL
jgi:hypothetical protein